MVVDYERLHQAAQDVKEEARDRAMDYRSEYEQYTHWDQLWNRASDFQSFVRLHRKFG